MKNILGIFRADVKRISRNVVAIVMILGLALIPSLYAWFNILSNWDPYGSDATSNMNIAVFSEDEGTEVLGVSVNVGDKLISELHANHDIGWVFPETKEQTMEGINSGDYYAVLLIPSDFTEDLMSFLSGTPESPEIQYYGNSKKNAVATKITSKVKTTIQRKINEAFLETLTLYSSEAADSALGDEGFAEGAVDKFIGALDSIDAELSTYLSVIDSVMMLNGSASGLLQSADAVIPEMENVLSAGSDTVEIMQSGVNAGSNTANAVIQMTDASLSALTANLNVIYAQAALISSGVDVQTITSAMNSLLDSSAFEATANIINVLDETPVALTDAYQRAVEAFNSLVDKINQITAAAENAKAEANAISASLQNSIADCIYTLQDFQNQFDSAVAPALSGVITDANEALAKAAELLGKTDTDFSDLKDTLSAYEKTLSEGTAALEDTRTYVAKTQEELEKLKSRMEGLGSTEAYKALITMLEEDPESLADYIASPVVISEKIFYEIHTFGSEMAPFYTILGIWAGALIMVALIKVKVEEDEENKDAKPWQKFFGRYLLFFIIGQLQALITVFGDLFFIGIECSHPVLFVLTGLISSFVFTLLMYSLTVAFRAVGQAIVVVILVIQVAGAGGTFPVEMLPEAYRMVYRFLPFNYAINAMRECVGGIYGNAFIEDIGKLLIFAGVGVVIGLVMMRPFEKLRALVDKSKENSGVML